MLMKPAAICDDTRHDFVYRATEQILTGGHG
jgi:hypothetical protein